MAVQSGVAIGINPGGTNVGNNYAFKTQFLADYQRLGLTRARFQYPWKNLEFPQGTYRWGVLDDFVSFCNTNKIPVCYTIANGIPTWALANNAQKATDEPFFAPDPTLTAGFAQAVVNRYGNQIQFFEIANETMNIENCSPAGGFHAIQNSSVPGLYGNAGQAVLNTNKIQPGRNPYFYPAVAQACYPILKSAGARVGMCAMWWTQPANPGGVPNATVSNYYAFLDYLFSVLSLPQYADYLNVHWYPNAAGIAGNNQTSTVAQFLADVQAILTKYQSGLKLRVTEFGFQVPQDAPDYNTQHQWYIDTLSKLTSSPIVEGWDFFTLDYNVGGSTHSLVTANGDGTFTYQPAYWVVQQFAQAAQPVQAQPQIADIAQNLYGPRVGSVQIVPRRPSLLQELVWGIEDLLRKL